MRTANPALNDRIFQSLPSAAAADVMTIDGTVNKTLISLALAFGTAAWSWGNPELMKLYMPIIIGTFIVFFALMFKPAWSPFLVPAYALGEGVVLGTASYFFETQYPGIVTKAVTLTFGVMFCMLVAYKSRWIVVTDKLRSIIVIGIGAIMLVYVSSFILSFFGIQMSFLWDSSPLSIGISLVVIGFAAASLLLDFDFIERASAGRNTPKYMEWYGAFGLLVSLVWLYFEILRLLAKLQSRD